MKPEGRKRGVKQASEMEWNGGRRESTGSWRNYNLLRPYVKHLTRIISFSLHNNPIRAELFSLILETRKVGFWEFNYCIHGYPTLWRHSWDLKAGVTREPSIPSWLLGREERRWKAGEEGREKGREEVMKENGKMSTLIEGQGHWNPTFWARTSFSNFFLCEPCWFLSNPWALVKVSICIDWVMSWSCSVFEIVPWSCWGDFLGKPAHQMLLERKGEGNTSNVPWLMVY